MNSEPTNNKKALPIIERQEFRKLPTGIYILSALHGIGGVVVILVAIMILVTPEARNGIGDSLGVLGVSPITMIIGAVLLGTLTIGSAIGMWTGRKWGWYLGSFYYVYSVFRDAWAIIVVPEIAESLGREDFSSGKYVARILFSSLVYLYFLRSKTLASFDIHNLRKLKLIAAQIGACVLIYVITSWTNAIGGPADTRLESYENTPFFEEVERMNDLFSVGQYGSLKELAALHVGKYTRSYKGWSYLGWAHFEQGENIEARKCLLRSIELNDSYRDSLFGMGRLCAREGNSEEAIVWYKRAIEFDGNYADLLTSLALAKLKRGLDEDALIHAEQAYKLDSSHPAIVSNLAIAYHYSGMDAKRQVLMDKLHELDYRNLEVLEKIFSGEFTIRDEGIPE
ncbi:MAG: tetratricopeptide repeat protein [Planctomycetes bacterium]|nr:tetratricopeptide repeat protein [Planctomycetota bacterium]